MSAKKSEGFTAEERAAMRERARELKAEAQRADGEKAVLAKIAEMPEPDRAMAGRLHEIVKASAPALSPKTWYGMPAYAKEGKVVCYFQSAQKFNSRYATLGFNDEANLDEGAMWPTSFALKELTDTEESKISALVKRAVSQAGGSSALPRPPSHYDREGEPALIHRSAWKMNSRKFAKDDTIRSMRIISLNVGLPSAQRYEGRMVNTGGAKKPVP